MKRRLYVASKAMWFKSFRNEGAGQEEKRIRTGYPVA
jgi:hypothetical protein